MDDSAAVRVCELSVHVGRATLLEDVSFECRTGEWTLLAGPTGAGKSTLMRVINGLSYPSRGQVWTLGTPIPGRGRRQARAVWLRTGTVLQEIALFETKSARGNVEIALVTRGFKRRAARDEAIAWLERLNMAEKVNEYPWRLSGGERQRVALARALAPRPDLLVLDEPTSALDNATAAVVLESIRELAAAGTTVIMSSHREDEVARFCDQRVALQRGRVIDVTRRDGSDPELLERAGPSGGRSAEGREANRDLDLEPAEVRG